MKTFFSFIPAVFLPALLFLSGAYFLCRLCRYFLPGRLFPALRRGARTGAGALSLALAGTLGVGNIVGVAGALSAGGPGGDGLSGRGRRHPPPGRQPERQGGSSRAVLWRAHGRGGCPVPGRWSFFGCRLSQKILRFFVWQDISHGKRAPRPWSCPINVSSDHIS